MMQAELFYRFGAALFIGLLIGLERERAAAGERAELLAGVRTFSLLGLLGCAAALVADLTGSPWPLVVTFLSFGLLLAASYFIVAQRNEMGLTTEVAAILTLLIGALCYWHELALAAALGVATTILLSLKLEMHRFARQISQEDVYATLQFAVITAIVLPVLPNESFGPPPLDVLNPYRIWLMVVFISGISFLGYLLIKVTDERRGIALSALLGGLVSSTAVTLSFAERSRRQIKLAPVFALSILIAWAVMFVRVLVEVAAVNRALLAVVWLPLTAPLVGALLVIGYQIWTQPAVQADDVKMINPFSLGPAMKFGLLYAVILLVTRTAQLYLGQSGVYISSMLAGVADVDAITLSMAELSGQSGQLALPVAAQAIVFAVLSNTLVKAGIVYVTGAAELRRWLLPSVAVLVIAASIPTIFLT